MSEGPQGARTGFRPRMMAYLMLIASGVTVGALFISQRKLASEVARDQERVFEAEEAALSKIRQNLRTTLSERCRALVHKPRILAAFEDDALDLLYPSARDELKDLMTEDIPIDAPSPPGLRARFYRFLDFEGQVIPPPEDAAAGALSSEEESHLALTSLPNEQQLGYMVRQTAGGERKAVEIIATPIVSSETGEMIAALVIGFDSFGGAESTTNPEDSLITGIWLEDSLILPGLGESETAFLTAELVRSVGSPERTRNNFSFQTPSETYRVFYKWLNPGSLYSPVYEVSLFSLADFHRRQRTLRWQILGVGGCLLVAAFSISRHFAARLAIPVEMMAADSEKKRVSLERAEFALEQSQEELERSARFSADTSHQLKTPVAVLRAGLEEMLAREDLSAEVRSEVADFIHQTHRLGAIVDDLLLLSKMDAGRFSLDLGAVDLSRLIAGELDDLEAHPEYNEELSVLADVPEHVRILGEPRFTTMIVRNLLENARKYNRPGGTIRVSLQKNKGEARLMIGNTGEPIPPAAQTHIFQRFHRGSMNENIKGHGLGLNIARDLARLHGGDLRLSTSADDWTEFDLRLPLLPEAPSEHFGNLS